MRALLGVSVLLTVAVAWATSAAPAGQERAALADLPVGYDDVPAAHEEPDTEVAADRPIRVETSTGSDRWAPVDVAEIPFDGSWIPLELRVVDGETGDPVKPRKASILAQSSPPPGGTTEPMWRSPTHVRRGGWVAVDAMLAAGPDHVPDDGGAYSRWTYVSRRAERVRLVAPLRREADVLLRVLDAGGRAVEGARVRGVTFGGREPRLSAVGPSGDDDDVATGEVLLEPGSPVLCVAGPTDALGWTRIRGIPHLLDARCWIAAGVEDHENYTSLTLGSFGASHAAEIRLPEAPSWVLPPQPMGRGGRGGKRNLRACCGSYQPARLEVVVFRREGGVATGVGVALGGERGTTDEYGRVVFEGLRPERHDLEVRDPDFVWSRASVELRDGERRLVEIVEPEGWTARATLLDSLGRRVPFAAVGVSSASSVDYVRVEDGVQELGLWTDANGEIELPRMHHAPVTLRFRYGGRRRSVTIQEGDPYATVRLPPP